MNMAAADFNRDGNLDLALTLNISDTYCLAVMRGNGDGTFQDPEFYSTDELPGGLAAVDLNADGNPDLVVDGSKADVYLGNGDGTFQTPVYYDTGSSPQAVVAGDFNGDGKLDLAIAGNPYLSILMGNGDGTFQPPLGFSSGGTSGAMAVGDMNQDNATDLVVGGPSPSIYLSRPIISVFPPILSFEPQIPGTSSLPLTVTLTNVGDGPLSITDVITTGDFSANTTCGHDIGLKASCTVDVTFSPLSSGDVVGTLSLVNNTTTSPQVIRLEGTGALPAVSLSTSTLTLPPQVVGVTSPAQVVTLTNSGNAALDITSVMVTGDFAESDNCGSSVEAEASCAINVTFTPSASGTREGALTISDNAPGSPHSVTLSGTGEDFSIEVGTGSSSSATVKAGAAAAYQLNIQPISGFAGSLSFACTGSPSEATCAVNPASAALNGSSATSLAVTVTTRAAAMAPPMGLPQVPGTPRQVLGRYLDLLGVLLVVLLILVATLTLRGLARSPWRLLPTIMLAIVLFFSLQWIACGGGSVTHDSGTPKGTYSLHFSATYTSGSTTVTRQITLTLTVT